MKFLTHLILSEIFVIIQPYVSICHISALIHFHGKSILHSTIALDSNFLAAFKLCNFPPRFVKRAFVDKREGKVNCA